MVRGMLTYVVGLSSKPVGLRLCGRRGSRTLRYRAGHWHQWCRARSWTVLTDLVLQRKQLKIESRRLMETKAKQLGWSKHVKMWTQVFFGIVLDMNSCRILYIKCMLQVQHRLFISTYHKESCGMDFSGVPCGRPIWLREDGTALPQTPPQTRQNVSSIHEQ